MLVDRLLREFKVDATVGKPQVAYRETIRRGIEKVQYRHIKQTGGKGQFADVVINLEPTGPGGGYEFVDKIKGGSVPREFIPSVDAGIEEALRASWPATRSSMCVLCWSTGLPTRSTRLRWPSRSPGRWSSRRPPRRPASSCSSP